MKELSEIINLDQLIQDKKKQIQNEQTVLAVLGIQREKLAGKFLGAMETDRFECNGVIWKKQKGRESVELKTKDIPEQYCVLTPDKRAILAAYREDPTAITSFADVVRSPEKLTYKVV